MSTTVELVELAIPLQQHLTDKDGIPLRSATDGHQRPYSIDIGTLPTSSYAAPEDKPRKSHDPDLERSRPPTPSSDRIVEVMPTWREPFMNRFRLLAVCIANLVNGLNDSAAGALIPYLER